MLNKEKKLIYNVRANCDAEVDQMVLEFPVLADYGWMEIDGKTVYMSHGHIYNEHNLPPLKPGDIFMHGHTHVLRAEKVGADVYKRQLMYLPRCCYFRSAKDWKNLHVLPSVMMYSRRK